MPLRPDRALVTERRSDGMYVRLDVTQAFPLAGAEDVILSWLLFERLNTAVVPSDAEKVSLANVVEMTNATRCHRL